MDSWTEFKDARAIISLGKLLIVIEEIFNLVIAIG